MLHDICERNEDNQFGVVICNIYKCVDIYALNIGRSKRKYFLSAYSVLVSRFGILDEDYSGRFCGAAERLYKNMAKKGLLANAVFSTPIRRRTTGLWRQCNETLRFRRHVR